LDYFVSERQLEQEDYWNSLLDLKLDINHEQQNALANYVKEYASKMGKFADV
jgi:hypothetical protein